MSHRRSFFPLHAPILAAAVLAAGLSATVPASAGAIPPSATNLSGTADRMVSYRHQEHSWVTPDGMYHLMYNRGDVPTGDGLQLASSTDGVTWTPQLSMNYTGDKTTSDGSFNVSNNLLSVVYSTAVNDIRFAPLKYDSTAKSWQLKGSGQVVRAQVNSNPASNPTMVEDANGNLWVAFLEQKIKSTVKQTGTAKIRLFYRPKDGKQKDWIDTGVVFGDDKVVRDLGAPKLSARILRTPVGLGIIYALENDIFWVQRPLSGTPQDPWSAPQYLVKGTGEADKDPYASHFSVATDGDGFMHLVYADGGIPYYRRYNAQPDVLAWSASSIPLSSVANDAAYPQVSWMGGKQIAILVNGKAEGKLSTLRVYQSNSRGAQGSFVCTDQMTHPDPTGTNMSFQHPRSEMPGGASATTAVPVVMQYSETVNDVTTYKAYGYRFGVSSSAGCGQ